MMDDGLGCVAAGPSIASGAEPEVRIFAVEKEVFIEQTYIFQHLAAVECGGRAGEQDILRAGEVFGGLALAALLAGPVERDEHSGGIEQVRSEPADLGCAHADIGREPHFSHKGGEPIGRGFGIVVESGQECGPGCFPGKVDGGSEAEIYGTAQDADGGRDFKRTGSGVVNDDDLEVAPGLSRQRFQAGVEQGSAADGGDGYEDRRIGHLNEWGARRAAGPRRSRKPRA